jgi:hypothetical protein
MPDSEGAEANEKIMQRAEAYVDEAIRLGGSKPTQPEREVAIRKVYLYTLEALRAEKLHRAIGLAEALAQEQEERGVDLVYRPYGPNAGAVCDVASEIVTLLKSLAEDHRGGEEQ